MTWPTETPAAGVADAEPVPAREVVTVDGFRTPFNAQSDAEAEAYRAGWADARADERDRRSLEAELLTEVERTVIQRAAELWNLGSALCGCVGYTIRTDYGTGVEHDVYRSSCPIHGGAS